MVKAIIFDCFGVIITDALERAVAEAARSRPRAAAEMRDIISAANHGLIEIGESRARLAVLLGLTPDEYQRQIVAGAAKDYRLMTYIAGLRRQYKTAILSNVGQGSLESRFTPQELAGCFDTVVASGDIGYAKPELQAYQIVARRLAVNIDECVFTDDRLEYVEGARAAGMQAIIYQSYGQFKDGLAGLLAANR